MTKAKISIIKERKNESAEYYLLEISVKEKTKYALCISRGGETDFALFDGNREACEHLLEKAVTYELSPIHIEDVSRDYKRELLDTRV